MPGVLPTSSPGTTPPLAPELRATRASTCNSPNDDDNIEGVLSERRQLKSLAFTVGLSADFSHTEEQPPSVTAFTYATGSPDYTGFSREETSVKILIPTSHADATDSPQRKDWQKVIEKETTGPTANEVYDLVPTRTQGADDHPLEVRVQAEGRRPVQVTTIGTRVQLRSRHRLRQNVRTSMRYRRPARTGSYSVSA